MIKDFEKWNSLKQTIDKNNKIKYVHNKEIWWCSIGINIGDEINGKNNNFERPVLVLKKFNKNLLKVIPLSTKIKEGDYYVNFVGDDYKYSVLLSQSRTISSKRLIRYISKISDKKYNLVKEKFLILLEL